MFNFIKNITQKIISNLGQKISSLFSRKNSLDESFFEELRSILLSADTGPKTTALILKKFQENIQNAHTVSMAEAKNILEAILISFLPTHEHSPVDLPVTLLVGVNGSGKTTFASKYAHFLKNQGKRVLLVAADTFRAAAVAQLQEWGTRTGVEVFSKPSGDPAAVIFDACKKAHTEGYEHVIIDTAGRLQTKANLMKELEKVRKVVGKQFPASSVATWLTIDAMIGQNSFEQAKVFMQATPIDGLIVTKLDGSAKGGIIFSLWQELALPIKYVTHGEHLENMSPFDAQKYVKNILEDTEA